MSLPLETTIILAAFFGNTVAVVVGAFLTARYGQHAQKATQDAAALAVRVAQDAALATLNAQQATATAQSQALEAAERLVEAAKRTNTKLDEVATAAKSTGDVLVEISKTGQATHSMVNNDRSIDKTNIARLTRMIAKLLPGDVEAEADAQAAQAEADRYPKPIFPQS